MARRVEDRGSGRSRAERRLAARALGLALVAFAFFAAASAPARADSDTPGKAIAGWVEKVVVMPWGITVPVKLDTGAHTSSIHGVDVERFEKDGEPWVRFTLVLEDDHERVHRIETEAAVARRVRIKQQEEAADSRPVIELELCMDGRRQRVQFSIAQRGGFNYSILLGRRFLEERFVIDPQNTYLTQASCGAEAPKQAGGEGAPEQAGEEDAA